MTNGVSRRGFLGALGASAAAVTGCAQAPLAESATKSAPDAVDQATPAAGVDPNATASGTDTSRYTAVYQAVRDSVVEVYVITTTGDETGGTGFVYDDAGHLLTNEHVVSDAAHVFVRFRSTGWRRAEIVGTDVYSDIAVLRVEDRPSNASALALVNRDPKIGQEVVAIGNPFRLSGSVSSGIVSGVNRTLPAANGFSIPDAIQTDAPVNPGNSGGPLVNLDGEVLGIINAGGGDNIGFAISGPLTLRVVPELIRNGEYEHSYMGVMLRNVTPSIGEANNLENARGVYISEIVEGGPSEGVLQGSTGERVVYQQRVPVGGDVIVQLGETPIPTRQALSSFLALQTSPGQTIDVGIIRDGTHETVQLPLGSRPEP